MRTLRNYTLGFGLSTAITLLAFGLVQKHLITGHVSPTHEVLVPLLAALAVLQLFVQLVFFIRLGEGSGQRWNLGIFSLTFVIIGILVGGTLWIMQNLQHGQGPAREIYVGGEISPYTQND